MLRGSLSLTHERWPSHRSKKTKKTKKTRFLGFCRKVIFSKMLLSAEGSYRSIENVKSARFCQGKKGFIELHFLGKTKRSASKQLQKNSRMLQVFRCSFSSASRIFVVASVELHFDSRIPAFSEHSRAVYHTDRSEIL